MILPLRCAAIAIGICLRRKQDGMLALGCCDCSHHRAQIALGEQCLLVSTIESHPAGRTDRLRAASRNLRLIHGSGVIS